MIWHILGWCTTASQVGLAVFAGRWLWTNGTEPIRRPVHVPSIIDDTIYLPPNDNFVGYC